MLETPNEGGQRIKCLLRPQSIAVVVRRDRNKLTGTIIPQLRDGGFKGRIYPVNPGRTEIAGLRSYPSLREIEEPVDHATVIVRCELVPDVLAAAAERGVSGASIFSSGFGTGRRR